MKFKLATWNINSVRLRIGLVERFVAEVCPGAVVAHLRQSWVGVLRKGS